MKYLGFLFLVLLGLTSCVKQDVSPPNQPEPIITGPGNIDSTYNLIGQTWVITGYRVGEIGSIIPISDTIIFQTLTKYTYNGYQATYSFYTTASAYNLTLNFTPYGNLSGTIYQGNLDMGVISGLKFTDITMGSGNQTNYYFWITRQ